MRNSKRVTQTEKIQNLHNIVKQAKILFFVAATKINRWEIKHDRLLLKKKWFSLYKTNIFRGQKFFNTMPLFKHLVSNIGAYFFVAYSRNKKKWKKLVDAFKLPLKCINFLFVIQNKTFLGPQRLAQILSIKTKGHISAFLSNSNVHTLIKSVLRFLTTSIVVCKNNFLVRD